MNLSGKRILITGGCGSIGSTLVRKLLQYDIEYIHILDNSEQSIHSEKSKLGSNNRVRFSIGNVRDTEELEKTSTDADIIFHTAALKHVGLVENNPYQAIKTNIIGTRNVVRAAKKSDTNKVVAISTDKASNPFSAMGATKLLSERLITSANNRSNTTFGCVRFGNVAGTKGSVIPIFLNQIRERRDLTVTNPEMSRFVMTPAEAANFVISGTEIIKGGEILVKKMPAFKLGDLVDVMINEFGPRFEQDPDNINVEIMGEGPGERSHEKLISEDEIKISNEYEDLFAIYPNIEEISRSISIENSLKGEYNSARATHLSKEEIINIVDEYMRNND